MNKLRQLLKRCRDCNETTGDVEKCLSVRSRDSVLAKDFLNGEMEEYFWDYLCKKCILRDIHYCNRTVFLFKDYNPKRNSNEQAS